MKFVNRRYELGYLEKEYNNRGAKFAVIYGRRRIGKTRLIEEFIKNKQSIYYLAAQEKDYQQIQELKNIIADFFNDKFLQNTSVKEWKQLFSYLKKIWPKKKRIIFAIDEITYIIKENPSFPSYLQKFWDTFLSKTNTYLILSGSMVGLILKSVLSKESPLYGRRTSQIELDEFSLNEAAEFMPEKDIEEKIKFYSVTGGVPKYLEFIQGHDSFDHFLLNNFFNKEGFFYKEGIFLISQEFNEPSTYIDILKAISQGNTKLNKIGNFVGIENKKISSYLNILTNLNFVKRIIPVTANEKKFRGAFYMINDTFLTFWHRFVNPYRSLIEMRRQDEILKKAQNDINSHIGFEFEKICQQIIRKNYPLFKIGKWWGHHREKGKRKELEIDICAIDKEKKEILLGECKWKDNCNYAKIFKELKKKANYVDWNKNKRKEQYIIFAKSFKNKKILKKNKNIFLYDLEDIEEML
ncbi:AAA family ATPase [Candidatus Woesearchaeota archaeon]|nr:AAA family ATPase [Candidatus Woesearchaeota archaeon]